MLRVSSVSKSFGGDLVLQNISFLLKDGDRVGLVGPNGCGKSTLLRLIAGDLEPDSGSVWLDPAHSVAYLPQYPLDQIGLSVRQSLLRGAAELGELQRRLVELERAMRDAQGEALDALLGEYAEAREDFERLGGYELEARMEEIVQGLALDVSDLEAPVSTLSGGNKTKLSLARLLLSAATILLLDEPTNYLDLPSLLWLERFVVESERSYVVVSHDRRFLDRTVSSILELFQRGTFRGSDAVRGPAESSGSRMREWPGNYSAYAEARLREQQKQLEAYRDQQERIKRIEEDIRRTKQQAQGVEKTASGLGSDTLRRRAKKVAKKATTRERKLERSLARETIEKPRQSWGLHLVDLGRDPIEDDRIILDVRNLHAGYDEREVVHGLDLLIRGRDRVALLGENGSGKSTLLRCIMGTMPYQGTVRIGPSVRIGWLSQESEELPLDRSVLDVFRSRTSMRQDEARTYLHRFLFTGDEVFKPVSALSYGQRSKLALAMLILSGANFLLLDEPTSHMDMPALEAIEQALASYRGPLLLVSHDRYFIERIGINRVEVMEAGRLCPVENMDTYEREAAANGHP